MYASNEETTSDNVIHIGAQISDKSLTAGSGGVTYTSSSARKAELFYCVKNIGQIIFNNCSFLQSYALLG